MQFLQRDIGIHSPFPKPSCVLSLKIKGNPRAPKRVSCHDISPQKTKDTNPLHFFSRSTKWKMEKFPCLKIKTHTLQPFLFHNHRKKAESHVIPGGFRKQATTKISRALPIVILTTPSKKITPSQLFISPH